MTLKQILWLCPQVIVAVGCAGPSFNREWKSATAAYQEDPGRDPVAGPWTGEWVSGDNGHTGELRCLASPVEGQKDRYEFWYHATWAKYFSGGYKAEFDAIPVAGGYQVNGSKALGPFGDFSHEGTIESDTFDSTFESSGGDHGKFLLKRPK